MPGTFSSYDVAARALQAFQAALDITGNNVTNVNTDGYSRQQVDFSQSNALNAYGVHPYQIGQGVNIATVLRIRDTLLDSTMWNAQSDQGKFSTLSNALQGVQGAFPEPGANGISAALGKFFDSWSALSANPGSAAAKLGVQQAGATLTARIRGTYSQLSEQSKQLQQQVNSTFDQVDALTAKIASLNKQIASQAAVGGTPNQLADERSKAIGDLSKLIDVQTYTARDGSIGVNSNQISLVDQAGATALPRTFDAKTMTLKGGSVDVSVHGGQLGGLLLSLQKVSSYQGQLDSLANNLKSQVNTLHRSGKNSLGKTGVDFFSDSQPQTGAVDFNLSSEVLASPDAIANGTSGNAGDSGLALSLSRLRSQTISGLGSKSFGDFYSTLVGTVGSDTQYYGNAVGVQSAVLQQIGNQRQAVSGVNVDEEMSNMLKFQRSYQAAARALSIFDQTTQDLIGLIK
jgi:flagellar hook-associated protein 1 FlgK